MKYIWKSLSIQNIGTMVGDNNIAHYRCDLCFCYLSSEEIMLSHVDSQQHLKKLNEYEREKLEAGEIVDPMSYIRPN